jgi:hypothetical protein
MTMEATKIDEEIRVGVAFDHRKALPIWFMWRGRYYKVEQVSYNWSTDEGSARLRHYAVTDGANNYEICFNSRTLEWRLRKVVSN